MFTLWLIPVSAARRLYLGLVTTSSQSVWDQVVSLWSERPEWKQSQPQTNRQPDAARWILQPPVPTRMHESPDTKHNSRELGFGITVKDVERKHCRSHSCWPGSLWDFRISPGNYQPWLILRAVSGIKMSVHGESSVTNTDLKWILSGCAQWHRMAHMDYHITTRLRKKPLAQNHSGGLILDRARSKNILILFDLPTDN